jgi:hypothetical protein
MFGKEEGPICPLIKSKCIEGKCAWWTHLLGTSPQTAQPVDQWGCAVQWLPMLLIENAKEVRQGAAATESFRNEVVKFQHKQDQREQRTIDGPAQPRLA